MLINPFPYHRTSHKPLPQVIRSLCVGEINQESFVMQLNRKRTAGLGMGMAKYRVGNSTGQCRNYHSNKYYVSYHLSSHHSRSLIQPQCCCFINLRKYISSPLPLFRLSQVNGSEIDKESIASLVLTKVNVEREISLVTPPRYQT